MKKYLPVFIFILVLFYSCEKNSSYVGTWKDSGGSVPCVYQFYGHPTQIRFNSDYSYSTTNGFASPSSPGISGTYDIFGDSLFLGSDSLLRFRVTLLEGDNLHFERNGDDNDCFTMRLTFKRSSH